MPRKLEVVPVELLRKIADMNDVASTTEALNRPSVQKATAISKVTTSTKEAKVAKYTADDVERLMTDKGLKFGPAMVYEGGVRWILEACPWTEEHSDGAGGSAIFLRNGRIGFDCKHAHVKSEPSVMCWDQ